MFIGAGTAANVVTVAVGSLIGLWLGDRMPAATRTLVTQALGLFTLVIAGTSIMHILSAEFTSAVGGAGQLVVLGSLLAGALVGSWLRVEDRLDDLAAWLQARFQKDSASADQEKFVTGFVTATIVFCVGPLTILGSLSDGLGRGADQLLVKAVMDGFAAIAFASSLGVGVLASALSVAVIQGTLTLIGYAAGSFLPAASIDALTATGGIILLAVAFRLLDLLHIRLGDLLPALVIAPAATWALSLAF